MRIDRFEKDAIPAAMKQMFRGSFFDITEVDQWLSITNTTPNQRVYRALRVLHCVHWSDMAPGFRRAVCEKIISLFSFMSPDLINMTFNEKAKVYEFPEKKDPLKLLSMSSM